MDSRTMTHPSPTALEEISGALDALRTDQRQLDQDGVFVGVSRQALDEVLTHIAALEAELADKGERIGHWVKCVEQLEAQLAARLPTEAQISYLLEVLAKEGMANDGGDFMRRKISKAILALLSGAATAEQPEACPICHGDCAGANTPIMHCPMKSGAATPAPTAALTEEEIEKVLVGTQRDVNARRIMSLINAVAKSTLQGAEE